MGGARVVAQLANRFQPIHQGHEQIGDDQIRRLLLRPPHQLVAVRDKLHIVTLTGQHLLQEHADIRFVFGNEDSGRCCHVTSPLDRS